MARCNQKVQSLWFFVVFEAYVSAILLAGILPSKLLSPPFHLWSAIPDTIFFFLCIYREADRPKFLGQ